MINIGKLIHEQVKRQGKSVTWLAQQLNYSRTNLYKIFDKTSIDTDVLLRISQALNYDFFALYSQELSSRH
ncbi:MAG TPA: helix-turn-helix transcriptional regulator [Candidatus Avimuribaculum pullicola]|nr:helix-turn-helix transcriptional regulator [Candidatus Avimuribaculum pullicola]